QPITDERPGREEQMLSIGRSCHAELEAAMLEVARNQPRDDIAESDATPRVWLGPPHHLRPDHRGGLKVRRRLEGPEDGLVLSVVRPPFEGFRAGSRCKRQPQEV